MATDELLKHIARFFNERRGARRIQWQDIDREMHAMTAAISPSERRRLAQLLRRLYRGVLNENYSPQTNGEFGLIRRLAPELRCVFDVGANIGRWTNELLLHAPNAIVHAFEPVPEVFAILADRLRGRTGARLNDVGLLDRSTSAVLNVAPADLVVSSIYPLGVPTHEVLCNFIAGDHYVERLGVAAIDFLKIDCEGAEPQILDGFSHTLKRGGVTIVQLEYGPLNTQSHWLLRDLYARFRAQGYRVGRLYPSYVDFKDYEVDDETFFGGNFVACLESRGDLINLMLP